MNATVAPPTSTPAVDTIDVATETLLSLVDAAKRIPSFRGGKRTDVSTVWRWCRRGVRAPGGRRLFLGHGRIGGRTVTSVEALARFMRALSVPPLVDMPTPRSPATREKARKRADAELAKRGL